MSANESELGGYKGNRAAHRGRPRLPARSAFESGGHRVKARARHRNAGRIHTSACTVAVMPEPDEHQAITLNPADLRIDTFRASGAGGSTSTRPTRPCAWCTCPPASWPNARTAAASTATKPRRCRCCRRASRKERSERAAKEAALRKGLIGSGDRSDRIRTYNFPQGRLTDHRINLTLYKLLAVMEGDLGDVLQALQHAREAEQLEELERVRGVTPAAAFRCSAQTLQAFRPLALIQKAPPAIKIRANVNTPQPRPGFGPGPRAGPAPH